MEDLKHPEAFRLLHPSDADYPPQFRTLEEPPEDLYVAGQLPDPERPSVAIVGARLCDLYGRRMAQDFGQALASNGVQIISGMASGIDGTAQRGALLGKGKTFAVLGCGVDICYPLSNRDLYEDLKKKGGLISQFPPGTQPQKWTFPVRNGLIAAFADIILVVEARRRSGSLITARLGLEQGKDVFAVPGRVGDELSDGCNELIADGAFIASSPQKILDHIRWSADTVSTAACTDPAAQRHRQTARRVAESTVLSKEARILFSCLSASEPRGIDSLVHMSGLTASEVLAAAAELVLETCAEQEAGGRYVRL